MTVPAVPVLRRYESFLAHNASQVSSIESTLRSLAYVLPGRFKDAELASETLYTLLNFVGLYHDSVLSRIQQHKPGQSQHARYTTHLLARSGIYRKFARLVMMLGYSQVLWEMIAFRKGGNKVQWRIIILLEGLKATLRLVLLRLSSYRPLLHPPLPERDIEDSPPSIALQSVKLPRTGLTLPSLSQTQSVNTFLLDKLLTADDIKPPFQLVHRVQGLGRFAEILYILRPLVYALLLKRYSKKNWRPWVIGISIDLAARNLALRSFEQTIPGGLRALTGLEKEELRRRGREMWWWMLRGAGYENLTKPYLESIVQKLGTGAILSLIGSVVGDYQYLWENYYFTTATI
ncbi:Peroxisomal membrane protein PEX16 [Neolecta irregularis DAH-3]|uniref:Peroxisomal membrane protein PEX16 n=1 Tax=Neolecta irregularis (strain DAH-3) TaxID=1198029 RepID=A0A1U7LHD1_NEOID|nr:Peroxisomal membrane protein PEX16 [Neolecta irregularis DAH-3]|eukprot:OLL22066.1 Peroxisomal membrane protein PEX16 [Neolecta irregularis DAH-3]